MLHQSLMQHFQPTAITNSYRCLLF